MVNNTLTVANAADQTLVMAQILLSLYFHTIWATWVLFAILCLSCLYLGVARVENFLPIHKIFAVF